MLRPLTTEQRTCVDSLLARMSLTECIHQTLCPALWKTDETSRAKVAEWKANFPELGGLFFGSSVPPQEIKGLQKLANASSRIPLVSPLDLENGPRQFAEEFEFPVKMAAGAAYFNNPQATGEQVELMGEATAWFGVAGGCRWTLGPVVDICRNPRNSIVMTRSYGENLSAVSELVRHHIHGIQKNGDMAATAKHFPGDGFDGRDQHYVTSVNSQSKSAWLASDGEVWRSVIESGVLSIMTGHIALPCIDPAKDFRGPPPATLSAGIQLDLLRGELGFDGLLVSDALVMGGVQSHLPAAEIPAATLAAGTDMLLFADVETDRDRILDGVRHGLVAEERIRDAARRVLEFKARIGLLEPESSDTKVHRRDDTACQRYRQAAVDLADRSITVVRDACNTIPLEISPGARLLLVNLFHEDFLKKAPGNLFQTIETELQKRHFELKVLNNPSHYEIFAELPECEAVLVNLYTRGMPGTRQLIGKPLKSLWRAFWTEHAKVIFTSFDNPYHLLDLPSIPALVNAYGVEAESQRAAIKVWLGEAEAVGQSPVEILT